MNSLNERAMLLFSHPEATFEGHIDNFDINSASQTKIVKGTFMLRNIKKPLEFKATIEKKDNSYVIKGDLEVAINDYDIKVPALLSPNISKKIVFLIDLKKNL